MSHTVIERDLRPQLRIAIPKAYRECHIEAAKGAREFLKDELRGGEVLNSDTGALLESLFVQEEGGANDFDERRDEAKNAYTSTQGFWPDIIRQRFQDAYTDEHFEERAAHVPEPLPEEARAALGTMMAYGWWWQMGHFNLFTQAFEQRSWFIEPLARWFAEYMGSHFNDFEAKVEAHL